MPNIEIKARSSSLDAAKELAIKYCMQHLGSIHQVDTYFSTSAGRLKLREIDGNQSQLIPYIKEYTKGPMKSCYSVLPVSDTESVKLLLDQILGTLAVVDKRRDIYLMENIRIHLDNVEGLGSFIEFEAVYHEDSFENEKKEVQKIEKLMELFGIKESDLLDRSYIDYLLT